jgi:AraC-like DNA-binding protein
MTPVQQESQGVRFEWASHVRNVQQAVVGDLLSGDLLGLDRAVRRMKEDLPAPANPAESLFLRQALVPFVDRSARHQHERFHASFDGRECRVSPPLEREADWLLPDHPIDELLDGWMAGYVAWFGGCHSIPIVWRATAILRERAAERWTTATLARGVGCCRTTLRQQFVHDLGMSPAEYIARFRVREGLRRLWRTTGTVGDASIFAGYRSCSKFYGRVLRYTGMTPAAIRALVSETFERLLDDCLPLRIEPATRRRGPEGSM